MSTGLDLREMPDTLRTRLEGFDSIVSWYGSKWPEFRDALLAINPNCEFHAAIPPADYEGHATDFFAQQVGAPLGLIPRIRVEHARQRNAIAIHPFSGSKKKNWPLERYRELAGQLGCEIDWLAGPEEDLPGAKRFDDLADLAQFIAGARMYIGNDSGITHLAAAVGVKTMAIFLESDPSVWAPRGGNVRVLRNPTNVQEATEAANRLLDWRSS